MTCSHLYVTLLFLCDCSILHFTLSTKSEQIGTYCRFIMVALSSRCGHYCIFSSCGFFLLLSIFSSPNLSGCRLDRQVSTIGKKILSSNPTGRTYSANFVKIAQGIRPCGAFIIHMLIKSQYKFQFWGSYTLVVAPMGVKYGTEEGTSTFLLFGPLLRAKFHHRCNVLPLRGEKPQNRPLSNVNTGALRCAPCCWYWMTRDWGWQYSTHCLHSGLKI